MNEAVKVRVLVAFDCNNPDREALARLPQILDSEGLELTGLYVEDEDLRRAARLPGLREVSLSGEVVELDIGRLEVEIADELRRVRKAFEEAARGLSLSSRFEVTRGHVAEALCTAALHSDFVLVHRAMRHSGLRARSALHLGPLASQARRILVVNEPWASGSSVVVLGTDPAAIRTGERLAAAESLRLVLAVRSSDLPPATRSGTTLLQLDDWREDALAELCLQQDARLLIVPGSEALDTDTLLTSLLDRLPWSLLKLG